MSEALKSQPNYCECLRCQVDGKPFTWLKRVKGRPRNCPNCKNPAWDEKPLWRWSEERRAEAAKRTVKRKAAAKLKKVAR